MPIEFRCESCGQKYMGREEAAGKQAKCKKCGAVMQIPSFGGDDIAHDDVTTHPKTTHGDRGSEKSIEAPMPLVLRVPLAALSIVAGISFVLLAIYTGFFLQYLCLGNRPIIIGEGARQLERIEEAIGSLILALWVMWGINWVPFFILVHLSCRKGKRWAQIVLTCWVVLAILGALGGIANAQHAPVAATSPILVPVVISLATGVILTYFVFLIGLWMPKSQAWMRARAIETKRNEDMFRRRFRI